MRSSRVSCASIFKNRASSGIASGEPPSRDAGPSARVVHHGGIEEDQEGCARAVESHQTQCSLPRDARAKGDIRELAALNEGWRRCWPSSQRGREVDADEDMRIKPHLRVPRHSSNGDRPPLVLGESGSYGRAAEGWEWCLATLSGGEEELKNVYKGLEYTVFYIYKINLYNHLRLQITVDSSNVLL